MRNLLLLSFTILFFSCAGPKADPKADPKSDVKTQRQISGIYPHLAYYNNEGECGTGAVVPWANRLWVITYAPHQPYGSSDKLYEITPDLDKITREESIGGTPANRMIHKESNQLFIGPYAIDANRNVRAIPYQEMPGRHTGNARHLFDPGNKIYYASMEEGFYEVDVNTLKPTMLYQDLNKKDDVGPNPNLPIASLRGVHGKGLYSGQGVMIYSNNGEGGSLSEWDGKEWKLVRGNQFLDVTGPGGIYGNENPKTDPVWTTGWDEKSLIIGVRNPETAWDFYRLPVASHTYDGDHGWHTEWPRIRDIGTEKKPDFLMTLHGMFWHFPETFTANNSAGIRPKSAYLKIFADYTRWEDKLVFGCDDAARRQFGNQRVQKGSIEGAGQSNSNLWFTSFEKLDQLGTNTAEGLVWLKEKIKAEEYSEPFLFVGWPKRSAWIQNSGDKSVTFVLEVDKTGNKNWKELKRLTIKAGESVNVEFNEKESGEWIRVKTDLPTTATVSFNYSGVENRKTSPSTIFKGLAEVTDTKAIGGLMYVLGNNRRALGISAVNFENGQETEAGYYELDAKLNLLKKDYPETHTFIKEKMAIPENVIEIGESSILVIDVSGRPWRLPLGHEKFRDLTNATQLRLSREVVTERDLFNAGGTFYELPAAISGDFAKVRPIASHNFRIHDYASYLGLLVMTGIDPETEAGEHIIRSEDGKAAVWLGSIDDLWEVGKPIGHGGPWKNSAVKAGNPSDPYLIGFYDKRSLEISHDSKEPVTFKIEVEPNGNDAWMLYKEVTVKPGETFKHEFSDVFEVRWIRFKADKNCSATAWLEYL